MKTKIGTKIANVTHDLDGHHFQGQKIIGQGHQAALLTTAGSAGRGQIVSPRAQLAIITPRPHGADALSDDAHLTSV